MKRFFISPQQARDGLIYFTPAESFRIRNVLRLKSGSSITALGNNGAEWEVELTNMAKKEVVGTIRCERRHSLGSTARLILALALPSHNRMDWLVQKSTELGVDEIRPFTCHRSSRKAPGKERGARLERIAKEAAEQSGRTFIPEIKEDIPFSSLLESNNEGLLRLILWEDEEGASLKSIISQKNLALFKNILIVIGPEGGFEPEEIETARRAEFLVVGMGKNILRVETAALAAISVIQFSLGRLG